MKSTKINLSLAVLITLLGTEAGLATDVNHDDRIVRRVQQQRRELTPNDELILSVKGYKQGAGFMVGILVNPLLGFIVAASSTSESQDDLKKIQRTLDMGADINYRDVYSWTALMHAAYGGYPGIVQFLLDKGAQKNLEVTKENTFLSSWKGYTAYSIAKHYLDQYQACKKDCKPDMIKYYEGLISKYQNIVELLR